MRSIVCQVNELSSTCFITLIMVAARPSGRVPRLRMNQRPPFSPQVASANVPLESKVQERIVFAAGSQPMICIPEALTLPSMEILNARVKKFWFFVQLQSSSTSALSASLRPLADHPFQRLELLVVRRDDFFGFVGHAVEQPFSISLYVDGRVLDLLWLRIRSQKSCSCHVQRPRWAR